MWLCDVCVGRKKKDDELYYDKKKVYRDNENGGGVYQSVYNDCLHFTFFVTIHIIYILLQYSIQNLVLLPFSLPCLCSLHTLEP